MSDGVKQEARPSECCFRVIKEQSSLLERPWSEICKPRLAVFPNSGKLYKDHRGGYKLLDNLQRFLCDLAAIVLANCRVPPCGWSHLSLLPLKFVTCSFTLISFQPGQALRSWGLSAFYLHVHFLSISGGLWYVLRKIISQPHCSYP